MTQKNFFLSLIISDFSLFFMYKLQPIGMKWVNLGLTLIWVGEVGSNFTSQVGFPLITQKR